MVNTHISFFNQILNFILFPSQHTHFLKYHSSKICKQVAVTGTTITPVYSISVLHVLHGGHSTVEGKDEQGPGCGLGLAVRELGQKMRVRVKPNWSSSLSLFLISAACTGLTQSDTGSRG